MVEHEVRAYPSATPRAREDQLAWKLAELACEPVETDPDVTEMIANRVVDNAGVALASVRRSPVVAALAQALAHPRPDGATLFGCGGRACAEWAAWANGVAVRELDFHDTFLAADYSHPGDNIPPLIAVAQQCRRSGADLIRAIATAYEVHVALVRGICLHRHKIDHIAHLGPAVAAGLGALLGARTETTYQAIQQALHCTITTRQSRKGEISSWKAFAPAHAGKTAIEAFDRAMRGEGSPSPAWEGEDGPIAWILDGRSLRERGDSPFGASYRIVLPGPGEPRRAIMETYTKAHSAEYQSQALIDLAFRMGREVGNTDRVEEIVIHTSHHTHHVIGSGANDPQKTDPEASRETLDHSILYIFAVALQDGEWHHERSYRPERARRPDTIRLWRKVRTMEDEAWTRRYHSPDPNEKAFGARVEIRFEDGGRLVDEIAVADAHPLGARPYARADYAGKFQRLTHGVIEPGEGARFLDAARALPDLDASALAALTPAIADFRPDRIAPSGIF